MITYKHYKIEKNEFGYYEATSLTDCDAYVIYDKTLEQVKTGIDLHLEDLEDYEN